MANDKLVKYERPEVPDVRRASNSRSLARRVLGDGIPDFARAVVGAEQMSHKRQKEHQINNLRGRFSNFIRLIRIPDLDQDTLYREAPKSHFILSPQSDLGSDDIYKLLIIDNDNKNQTILRIYHKDRRGHIIGCSFEGDDLIDEKFRKELLKKATDVARGYSLVGADGYLV